MAVSCPGSPCCSHGISLCFFFFVCPKTSSDVFRTADFRFSHQMLGKGSFVQGDSSRICCKSAWNLAFTSSQHRVLTLIFFLGLPFFLCLGLNCSLSLQRTRP